MKIEKLYNIYAKDKCVFHSITEEEFPKVWQMVNHFVEIMGDYRKEDLYYKEISISN